MGQPEWHNTELRGRDRDGALFEMMFEIVRRYAERTTYVGEFA